MRSTIGLGLLLVALLTTPAWAAGEIGVVKSVAGTATVIRAKAPLPAKPGLLLRESDIIQTGKNGSLGITFIDNSRFAVGPNSNLALSQFEFDDTTHRGRFLTTVNKGRVAIVSGTIAKENKDAMKVRTPVSLLAARGTRRGGSAVRRLALRRPSGHAVAGCQTSKVSCCPTRTAASVRRGARPVKTEAERTQLAAAEPS